MNGNITIHSDCGKIKGYQGNDVFTFKGIPYAEPPIGVNRFAPPVPVKAWDGVFDARVYSPICPQAPSPREFSKLDLPSDEAKCLTLNIWIPEADNQKRPVLVWIHGGSLAIGTGAEYDGAKLAQRGDVVVVTINYRLGIFGFLFVPGKTANVGLLDQVEALKWVKRNINQFGGDPENITLFGESAGAMSITALMSMPRTRGLFKRVILESNACTSFHHKKSNGKTVSQRIFAALGVPYGDLEALHTLPSAKLLETYRKVEITLPQIVFYPPFVDGDVLPIHPLEAIANGVARNIEVLWGYNSNEASLFSIWDPNINNLTEESLQKRITGILTVIAEPKFSTDLLKKFIEVYLAQIKHYSVKQIWENFSTDYAFRMPLTRFVESQSQYQQNIYAYEFAWKTTEMDSNMGATHALELHFVFDRFESTPLGIYPASNPEVEKISHQMMDSWVAFARSGNPNHTGLSNWPKYSVKSPLRFVFDTRNKVANAVDEDRYLAWREIG